MTKNYKKWKSSLLLCFLFATALFSSVQAQVSTYGFSTSLGTYTAVTGGTQVHVGTTDDAISAALPIGFNFVYNGTTYTTLKVNSNGWASFGTTTSTGTYTPLSTAGTHHPCLAPLGRDLQGGTTGAEVRVETQGVAPNRVFVVNWINYRRFGGTQSFNFQIKLYETSYIVEFVYGTMTAATSSADYDCGITGATNADFNARTSTTSWAATTAAATNAANMTISSTVFPASGRTLTWSPPPPPDAITEVVGTPDCVTGTNIEIVTTPVDPTVFWYWQGTNAAGTSMASSTATPFNVMSNGTYYARAFHSTPGVWSAASTSIVINSIPVAATPPAPTADINPSCFTTGSQLSSVLTGDANITYYWQTVANGTAMTSSAATDLATTSLTAPTTGTYYVSAFDASNSCWSPTSSIAVTVGTVLPISPVAVQSVIEDCATATSIMVEVGPTVQTYTYTLNMYDSYGDGWNGNTMDVLVDGIPVLTGVGITDPSGTALTLTFPVQSGSTITTNWIGGGSFVGETSYDIKNQAGTIIGGPLSAANIAPYMVPVIADGVNWYESTMTTNIGTANPLEAIGTVDLPVAALGSYEFYATYTLAGCESATPTLVTININEVNVSLTPIDETCIGYSNGSFALGTVSCGTAPFDYNVDGAGFGAIPTDLTAGTYSVIVRDDNGYESPAIPLVIGSASTFIPEAPTASVNEYFICTGETTQPIEATVAGTGTVTIPLTTNYSLAAGGTGVFNGNISIPAGATITSADIIFNNLTTTGGTWFSDIDFNLTGAITKPVTSLTGTTGTNVGPQTYPVTVNTLTGAFTMSMTDTWGSSATTFGSISVVVNYTLPATSVEWYDMATNGNLEGIGSPLESISTTLLPSPAAAGSYEFYAGALAGGCYSVDRTLVTVNVNDVNVELTAVDASCNNSPTGSFIISNVICGTAPFEVNVDGAGFGTIPTDLMAGTYSVVVMDDLGGTSGTYTLVVGEADAPSGSYMEDITDNGGQVSWNANGNETEWNVEWGLPGFIPGTGAEIGSTQAMDTFAIITGLDGNTNYDVYISANCGAGTTAGSWDMVNWTTDCGIYTLPFEETFEDNSPTRVCWINENEVGTADWTYQTGSSGGVVTTAFEGTKNARFVSVSGTNTPITKLASPRFDFSGQDSVALIFAYAQESWGTQNITKVYTNGPASVWNEIASYTTNVNAWTIDTLFVADTTVQIAFEGTNNWGRANVIDHVRFMPCTLNPGIDGSSDVCRLDGTFDLNTIVTKGEDFGTWTFAQNPGVLNGSVVSVSALPAGTFEFYYIVKTPCAEDTTTATLTIFPPSSAGVDGTITACRNEPIYLLSGLTGNVDLGGQWYNPSNNPTNVSITTGNIPGSYNYDYIVSNGVCPNDTSNILVTVGTCDYLDIQELVFGDMNVYPNPTDGLVFISNTSSSETFNYEILDVKGSVLSAKMAAINGTTTTEISLEKLEPGVYMIKVYNAEAEKTFRIIKQ